uniref:Uncharacterized protein n=1 Tax=Helianthus annuus TaxID=4232 RepID=A0A251SMK2_HELAN
MISSQKIQPVRSTECNQLSRFPLGMKSYTKALKSLPWKSILEQAVMTFTRLR